MHRTGFTGFTGVLLVMPLVLPGPVSIEPCTRVEALAALEKYNKQWDQPEYAS